MVYLKDRCAHTSQQCTAELTPGLMQNQRLEVANMVNPQATNGTWKPTLGIQAADPG